MLRRLMLLNLLFLSLMSQAQMIPTGGAPQDSKDSTSQDVKRTIQLYGSAYDSFTKVALSPHITLMTSDSTVIDTVKCMVWSWGTSNSYYEFYVPRKPQHFILKATLEGYHDTFLNYDMKYIARNREFELPPILMKKKAEEDDIFKEHDLEGVVVTGTKVKIAYRGDTVVYNASAFNLPEGSMLDGLVREMPGAELKDNGDIYVNGKKVDYLTLNGKDFFKGNNKVMLDNLPYYTVQSVEVFDKSSETSQWKGEETGKKDYVMDVKLKREYNRGVLVNTEAGVGTDDRFLARLFSLYYTDHTRLSVFGNTNNINEERKPGYEGEWTPSNMPQGLRSVRQVGVNLTTEDQDKNVEDRMDATVQWSDVDNETRTTSERFADEGSIFSGSKSVNRQKDVRLNLNNMLIVNKPFKLQSSLSLNYSDGKNNSESRDSTFRDQLINMTRNASLNKYRSFSTNGHLEWFKKLPWGDNISVEANGSYTSTKPSESFSYNITNFMQTGQSDLRRYYTDNQSHGYGYQAMLQYTIHLLNDWSINPSVGFQQDYQSNRNMNYRLDWLGTLEGMPQYNHVDLSTLEDDNRLLGWLPSNDVLVDLLDSENSTSHNRLSRSYTGQLTLYREFGKGNGWFDLSLPLRKIDERMHYTRHTLDTIATRSDVLFNPRISFYTWGKQSKMLYYQMSTTRPDFASLMPYDDTTNPLSRRISNPDLKNTTTHMLYGYIMHVSDSTSARIYASANASLVRNAMGNRTIYDPQKGAYTFKPDNVNGNWNSIFQVGYERPIDKKKLLTLNLSTEVSYAHSVDFGMIVAGLSSADDYSKVNTTNIGESLSLKFQKNALTLTLDGDVRWRHSKGSQENFETINAWDYNYGLLAKYTIPLLKLDVATDMKMFSRRGYNSNLMNTDDLVWNASIARSFLKGKMTAKIMAFDILHQLSSTQYSVNAQGRTETWRNCIPRYAMLTLAYKFQKMPKKKMQKNVNLIGGN